MTAKLWSLKRKTLLARLQARGRLINPQRISRVSVESPAVYVAFDVLYADGKNVMEHPLRERKTLLAEMVNPGAEIIVPDFILQNGRSFYDACVSRGLEGVVAKKLDSVYLPGRRSIYWQNSGTPWRLNWSSAVTRPAPPGEVLALLF